jgi:prepilin-type N-terminal cleavage/methylation domain-containing protein
MKKKLRSQKGMTFIELVAAVMIMSLLGLMLQSGIGLAVKSYRRMTADSETQLLLSTATSALTDELRYARDIKTNEDTTLNDFTSVSFGRHTTLSVSSDGQLMVNADSGSNGKRLIATGAYGNGAYSISLCEITYDSAGGIFHVRLSVSDGESGETDTEFDVRCLNSGK